MADANHFRVALRYRQWDRKWWEVFGNNNATIAQVVATLTAVKTAALAFRHPAVFLTHARVSNPLAPRQAQIVHLSTPDTEVSTTQAATTSTSAIYEFAGTDAGVKRHIWLRGLRASNIRRRDASGQDYPAGPLNNEVKAYFEVLRNNGYGIPNLFPVDNDANRRIPIDSITVLPLGKVKVNAAEAFVPGTRKRFVLYQIDQKLFPGLKGRFRGIVDGTGFIPVGFYSPLAEGDYAMFEAAFRKEEYRFTPFRPEGAQFLAFDRRDTAGGPLDTAGRQKSTTRRGR